MVHIGERANANKPRKWDMDCLRAILCDKDQDIMAKAKKLKVVKANVFFDDQVFKNGKWEPESKEWGGSAYKNEVTMSANASCEGAADTIYHEVLHTEQPASMSSFAKEMEAYTKTEAWLIDRGLPGTPAFRKTDSAGNTVVDDKAIAAMLTAEYPDPITDISTDGLQVKEGGVWRAAKDGDRLAGPQRLENVEPIDPKEFECPAKSSKSSSSSNPP